MKYKISKTEKESAYFQLYKQLRSDIVQKILPSGARLPSKRQMAQDLGISVITVEHAYALLVDEGYVESRARSGYYVDFGGRTSYPDNEGDVRLHLPQLPLSEAMEDFPFSVFAKTIRTVLADYGRRILIKSDGQGSMELRLAISRYLRRSRGIEVSPEQIIVGSGAEYLYGLIVLLLGRDGEFALEDPSYNKIRRVYELNGAKCLMLKMGIDGIVTPQLNSCRAGALHVTPFHSYPSGITASAAKRHEYASWAIERGSIIIEDDYDSEFASVTKQIDTIFSLAPDNVIYVNTFSKILAPSFRMGFMVLPERLLELYREKLSFYSCTVPVLDQYILAEFIDGGHMERYINRRRRRKRLFT